MLRIYKKLNISSIEALREHLENGAIEKKFNDLGIFHYWQLAELDHDTAHKIGEEVGLPSRADGWVAQAKTLTAE